MDEKVPYLREMETQAGEIEITQILLTLWNHKTWIITGTAITTLVGIALAVFATPVYHSEAILALKETGKGNNTSNIFSQFGSVGGVVAAQLGSGNTSLNNIEITLKGHELAESIITTNNLLPVLFRKQWDSTHASWISKNPKKIPTLRTGAEILKGSLLSIDIDPKKGLIRIGINSYDPFLAKQLVDYYIAGLNNKIRQDVVSEAEQNREFLENQLSHTSDPILVEKINNLIANEIEKMMFASSQSLTVLESPVVPLDRSSPKRKKTVMMSFVMGFFLSTLGIFTWKGFVRLKAAMIQSSIQPAKDV